MMMVPALAVACPPAARLSGDPELVATVGELLTARGVTVAGAEPGACSAAAAHLERRGDRVVVARDDDAANARAVAEVDTAASLIESWARTDVAAPLLASHAAAAPPPSSATPPTGVEATTTFEPRHHRGVQLFGATEATVGSDRTAWAGAEVGACVLLEPVCVAARIRFARVVAGPGGWGDQLMRQGGELLLGADIPFRLGATTLSPGVAAGIGVFHTQIDGEAGHASGETGGLRAEIHASLSVPLRRRLALDVSAAAELTQATKFDSPVPLPEEPRTLFRVGIGLRFGGL